MLYGRYSVEELKQRKKDAFRNKIPAFTIRNYTSRRLAELVCNTTVYATRARVDTDARIFKL